MGASVIWLLAGGTALVFHLAAYRFLYGEKRRHEAAGFNGLFSFWARSGLIEERYRIFVQVVFIVPGLIVVLGIPGLHLVVPMLVVGQVLIAATSVHAHVRRQEGLRMARERQETS